VPSSKSAETQEEQHTMVAPHNALGWVRKGLDDAAPDLLSSMVKTFAESLMNADVQKSATPCTVSGTPERPTPAMASGSRTGAPWQARLSSPSQAPSGLLLVASHAHGTPQTLI
jgi:hypothetical protein